MVDRKYQCEYYRVTTTNENNCIELYDLLNWIKLIEVKQYQNNVKEYLDDYVRVEDIFFDHKINCWFMQFVRIRNKDFPLLCTMDEVSVELALEENQFVAEPMVCMYDPTLNVLMLQKNRDSISSVGLKNYFNEFIEGNKIHLERIINPTAVNRINGSEKTTKIKIRLAELDKIYINKNDNWWKTRIGKAIEAVRGVNIPYLELSLSVGRYRSREINEDEADYLINKVVDSPELFDKVEYTVIEEGKSQIINVFSDVVKDTMSFNMPDQGILRFDVVSQKMGEIYFGVEGDAGRKHTLMNILAKPDEGD